MQVLFCAGEASGDLYAASLARELSRLDPTVRIGGIGGARFAQVANEPLIADSSRWGAISISQSFREGFKVLRHFHAFKRALRSSEPGVFVPIDFGFVNLKFCRAAKEAGWKVVYFVPPGSWRRDRQGADVPSLTDVVVTPFPWSYEILKSMGANVHFFGHPLKQIHKELIETPFVRSGLAVLPGSRRAELEQLIPVIGSAIWDYDGVIQLPVPEAFVPFVESQWLHPEDKVVNGTETGAVMRILRSSVAGVICSGTATLEAALAQTPMVVVYKISQLTLLETKLIGFKKPQFVSQPNILLQREVVPELIQHDFTVDSLRRTLDDIQTDAVAQKQRAGFDEISELLGGTDCITKTAELILGK
jgi:lipid-A-disaccharide synthase